MLYIYIHWWQPILWWTIYCALGHIHSSEDCTKRRRSDTADTAVYRCLTLAANKQLQNKRCRKVNPTKIIEVPSGKQTWQWKTPCFSMSFPAMRLHLKRDWLGRLLVRMFHRCAGAIDPLVRILKRDEVPSWGMVTSRLRRIYGSFLSTNQVSLTELNMLNQPNLSKSWKYWGCNMM
jgi:hypothetical protein